jgi:hypothetical protein
MIPKSGNWFSGKIVLHRNIQTPPLTARWPGAVKTSCVEPGVTIQKSASFLAQARHANF